MPGIEEVHYTNRLAGEKSPYLLQHAHNPVDWYPWGAEAFTKAEREGKAVFLSIGYSTCHWCHVMAHESFEDREVAELLNDAFVCIKVDREERPDIDGVYMEACQMMTGSGGWPLTIVMTPDRLPFFAATYIPRENRFGRMGLLSLIPRLRQLWVLERPRTLQTAREVASALQRDSENYQPGDIGEEALDKAYEQLRRSYDAVHGGFGRAPKFPSPHNILFLLRYHKRKGVPEALSMACGTLEAMRRGGIFDHLGFGFHRYSTDERWLVPHFEKMLYDQAMLLLAFTEAFAVTGREEYRRVCDEVLQYVSRDLSAPGGGFYSAEDADSEGREGKYYLWSLGEIKKALDSDEADLATKVFSLHEGGNFHGEDGERGANILYLAKPIGEYARTLGIEERELTERMEELRRKLFLHRRGRTAPHRDEKILTDWNALMTGALARAGRSFSDERYAAAAEKAMAFSLSRLREPGGLLLHRHCGGESAIPAFLDDYAFMTWALVELYEATSKPSYLEEATRLSRLMKEFFKDDEKGGFFFTAGESDELPARKKEIYDGAVPSGNSMAMLALVKLARLTGDSSLEGEAWSVAKTFSRRISEAPMAHTMALVALESALDA
ncbi:MAG: thioredoxin domain-containing protein [Candidatus Eremiobacteraeota bacterium]|nr:thioredoxin domain-containing protein [Candidatus Eremiobacteraeota bacterium]